MSYKKSNTCGCSSNKISRKYSSSTKSCGCAVTDPCNCKVPLQQAPVPCCESHETIYKAGVCLHSSCNVVASTDRFILKFSNLCESIPIDTNNLFLYHAGAGLLRIINFDGEFYTVELVDEKRAGVLIETTDCIVLSVQPQGQLQNGTRRCLTGKFAVPAINDNATIYIENGSSIPLGSTITFTANGEVGSYLVTEYITVSEYTYTYKVQNTGNGHTAGTIIDGGCEGVCIVPIEVITDVDICDLSETTVADSITVCENGSPRALVSEGVNDIITGDGNGGWELSKATNLDCCVVIDGCLKFSGSTCNGGTDSVLLKDTNLACFEAAWDAVLESDPTGTGQTKLPMNIDGFDIVVTDYNPSSKLLTASPADPDALEGETLLSWDAGQQICLGECCKSCLNGPRFTNHKLLTNNPLGEAYGSVVPFNSPVDAFTYEEGALHHYLLGYDYIAGKTIIVTELDSTYDDNPEGTLGKPVIEDPLLFRNKICNEGGCDKIITLDFNYELAFHPIPKGVRVHYTIENFVYGAKYLADNITPNPFNSVSSQEASAGYIEGASNVSANAIIQQTSIGYGNKGNIKYFPYIARRFGNIFYLEKCNCALSIIWFYIQTEVTEVGVGTGTFSSFMNFRQYLTEFNANERYPMFNNTQSNGFNG